MRVDDRVRKGIVFVGLQRGRSFVAYGTGFIVITSIGEAAFQTVVTARHVIDKISRHCGGKLERVDLRVNTRAGAAQILPLDGGHWHSHPDPRIDVAVCGTVMSPIEFDIVHLPLTDPRMPVLTPDIIRERDIGMGDEIYIAGMYVARLGETKNIPIIRSGTIAAMPEEKIQTVYGYHDAYLIEARSIDGLSGSPVFVQTPLWRVIRGRPKLQEGHVEYLMGMLLGHNEVKNAGDTIEILSDTARPDSDKVEASVPLNTGIGIVLPIQDVIDAVEQPIMREKREALIRKASDRPFVADAAGGRSSPPATDANPTHREDFTRLLGAAARKPPQED